MDRTSRTGTAGSGAKFAGGATSSSPLEQSRTRGRPLSPGSASGLGFDVEDALTDTHSGRWASVRRIGGRFALLVAPILILSLLAGVVGYVRLLHGPVSLKIFAGPIERGIGAEFGDLTAEVDDAVVRFSEAGNFEFRLINLRLLEADGSIAVSAPVAAVALDLPQLLKLQVVPRKVELIDPRLSLSYTGADGLALSFSVAASSPDGATNEGHARAPDGAPLPAQPQIGTTSENQLGSAQSINLARALADYTARARRRTDATSYLRELALRNALLRLDFEGSVSEWRVPSLSIDLDHRSRRSMISSVAEIESRAGTWALSLLAEDSEKTGVLALKVSVRDLVPATLGAAMPQLALLHMLNFPVAANAAINLSTSGGLRDAELAVELGRGWIDLGTVFAGRARIEAGLIRMSYAADTGLLTLANSTLQSGGSRVTLSGRATHELARGGADVWAFDVTSSEGVLAAQDLGVDPVPLQELQLAGRFDASQSRIDLTTFRLLAGGSQAVLAGVAVLADGPGNGVQLSAAMSPASVAVAKAIWPSSLAPEARSWFGQHVVEGELANGTLQYSTGSFTGPGAISIDGGAPFQMAMKVDITKVVVHPFDAGGAVMMADASTVSIDNATLRVAIPAATLAGGAGLQGMPLEAGSFTVANMYDPLAIGEFGFRSKSGLAPVLGVLQVLPFDGLPRLGTLSDKIDGKFDGQFKLGIPLNEAVVARAHAVEGKARITDIRSREKIGLVSVQSGKVDVEVGADAASAQGDLILNGVLAKLDWRRSSEAGSQPALQLSATLDNSDRIQLGIDVNDYLQGEVPVVVHFARGEGAKDLIKVSADLTQAELALEELAWRKAAGQRAQLRFDVVSGSTHKTELQNFKLTGESIGAEGWIALGEDNSVREFHFPEFSLNVVGRMEVQGRRGRNGVWDLKARGSTFDGKDYFRSLFTVGAPQGPAQRRLQDDAGLDLKAEIDNVLGHEGVALRKFRLNVSRRAGLLTALDARGTLDGGQPLAVLLSDQGPTQRKILADSTDAGQALRLVGFYPNMQGGRVRLEVDLDGRGAAEKTGVLWIDNFKVLGDEIVAEVVSGAEGQGPAIAGAGQRRVVREVLAFDRLKMPFAVGHGQFVVEESYIRGAVLGATLRGKVDYGAQRVNLGGTYIPLQGLNNMLGGIPVVGQILSGPRGEGVFGITFAIQGPMARPQVIVNPLSLVAPGIFREMFQMTNPTPTVQPRMQDVPRAPADQRVRASSSSSGGVFEGTQQGVSSQPTIDGWSSDTVVPTKKR